MFAFMGGFLWLVSALFVIWAFGQNPSSADWALMHHQKLEAAVGVGLAGIGTLFICFAALMSVVTESDKTL
jgi:membrane protein DedA with SNARE-associated domain